jgi:hypothetical protein
MNLRTLTTALIENGGFSYSLSLGDVFGTDNGTAKRQVF